MSALESLRPRGGSTHKKIRVGRGNSSGKGGTAGKGHKGQKARKGGSIPRGFEGGQMPIQRRLPKFGFKNTQFTTRYDIVNLKQLNAFDGEVSIDTLKAAGLVNKGPVKILGEGSLDKALQVAAHKFSASAKAAIEAAGGQVTVLAKAPATDNA